MSHTHRGRKPAAIPPSNGNGTAEIYRNIANIAAGVEGLRGEVGTLSVKIDETRAAANRNADWAEKSFQAMTARVSVIELAQAQAVGEKKGEERAEAKAEKKTDDNEGNGDKFFAKLAKNPAFRYVADRIAMLAALMIVGSIALRCGGYQIPTDVLKQAAVAKVDTTEILR